MENDSDIAARIDLICEGIRGLLTAVAAPARQEINEEAEDIRRSLEVIRAKETLTVPEAALLLNCSDSHLYNLIQKAMDGVSEYPIPYSDLDGTQRFPKAELLEWSRTQKPKAATPIKTGKKQSHLSIAASSRRKRGS